MKKQEPITTEKTRANHIINKEKILEFLKKNNVKKWVAEYLTPEMLDDRNFVLELVRIDGGILKYVSSKLRDDYEIVVEAIKQSVLGSPFEFASPRLQENKEIVLMASNKSYTNLKYASPVLKADIEFIKEAMKQDFNCLTYAEPRLRKQIMDDFFLTINQQ
jgi:hypothetical protein